MYIIMYLSKIKYSSLVVAFWLFVRGSGARTGKHNTLEYC